MCKGGILVVVGIQFLYLLEGSIALGIGGNVYATGKAAALGNEEHSAVITGMQFLHGLVYLQKVLVVEGLVDGDVVVAPTEMRGCAGLLTSTGGTGYAVHVDVSAQQSCLQCRKQCQLYAGGKATGIGKVHAVTGLLAMCLGQTVDIVVVAGNAEVLCQVYDAHMCRDVMLLQEGTALAMTKTEEHHVDLLPGHLAGKAEVGLAIQALVHFAHRVAGIRFAIGKDYLCLGMIEEHADKFTASVTCCSKYAYSNHILICLWRPPTRSTLNVKRSFRYIVGTLRAASAYDS